MNRSTPSPPVHYQLLEFTQTHVLVMPSNHLILCHPLLLLPPLEVEQGNQLSPSLEGKPYMPTLMVRMIAAGEKAGKVEDMLDSVADAYDEDVEVTLGTLTSLMEPFLMVFLGVVIGTIVLAMFLPIFNLGSIAH